MNKIIIKYYLLKIYRKYYSLISFSNFIYENIIKFHLYAFNYINIKYYKILADFNYDKISISNKRSEYKYWIHIGTESFTDWTCDKQFIIEIIYNWNILYMCDSYDKLIEYLK